MKRGLVNLSIAGLLTLGGLAAASGALRDASGAAFAAAHIDDRGIEKRKAAADVCAAGKTLTANKGAHVNCRRIR